MLTANNWGDILIDQFVIVDGSKKLLDDADILWCNLSRRIKPSRWACAGRDYQATAFELAHVFIVHLQLIHTCIRNVLLSSEHLIQAQLLSDGPVHLIFNLEQCACPEKVIKIVIAKVLQQTGYLDILMVESDLRIKESSRSSRGIAVNAKDRCVAIGNYSSCAQIRAVTTYYIIHQGIIYQNLTQSDDKVLIFNVF